MTTKLFTLRVTHPTRIVQFQGVEYPSLREASEAIVETYADNHALEILGRAFVLKDKDAKEFFNQDIPFRVGLSDGHKFTSVDGKVLGGTDHIHWVDNAEDKKVK